MTIYPIKPGDEYGHQTVIKILPRERHPLNHPRVPGRLKLAMVRVRCDYGSKECAGERDIESRTLRGKGSVDSCKPCSAEIREWGKRKIEPRSKAPVSAAAGNEVLRLMETAAQAQH